MKKDLMVKVCGMTDRDNMQAVARLQPDFMGFIFYPPSPRDVSGRIAQLGLDRIPREIITVAVMVNPSLQEARTLARQHGFGAVQLHGNESPITCRELRNDLTVIKSFAVDGSLPGKLEDYAGSCDYFLFDTASKKMGGSGRRFDHSLLKDYTGQTPFFIAGGICPQDAEDIAGLPYGKFFGADLNSCFETKPGIKDPELLRMFFRGLRPG
jgi:phosphoribosylanthranilate isomerase